MGKTTNNPVVLNPDDEFESKLIAIAKMHRKKSETYGSEQDDFQNFINGGMITGQDPLDYCYNLIVKHISAVMSNRQQNGNIAPNRAMDDAFIDIAVYGVLLLCLYERKKNGN